MTYTYKQCLDMILTQVERYRFARKNIKEWDRDEFQSIRDNLSEALLFFGPTYADLRSAAEQAEMDRKLCYVERKKHWKAELGTARGTIGIAEDNTLEDCAPYMQKEVLANNEYYKAKILMERADQLLNSISSRLKTLIKHDS